ncbi:acyl-CoA dehydrogenase family protein, partial [Aquisalimonas sp.]
MDFELNDDQVAFQETAREFAERELAPNAARWDEECIFPVETLRLAGELGFCGVYCPEDVGGLGLSRLDATIIFEALAGGCTSTTAYITIHNMATWMVATFGQEAVREAWCPQLTAGEKLASYCLTEPGAGSDAASLRTKAVRDGDGYRLTGSKVFISGAGETDLLVVMARTGREGAGGVSAFAVPADAEGITYGRKEGKMGWNSQPTRGITFEDVFVPEANRLGGEGDGFKIAMKGLDGGRLNVATCSVGTAAAALDAARRYAAERKQFGQALAEFQGVQFKLADMATELVAARQMVRLGAARLDAKHPEATTYCAMAKRLATDLGFRICNEALQIHGGY